MDRGGSSIVSSSSVGNTSQSPSSVVASGLVGDRRISLGSGAGCAGLAAQLEQGYRQAREAVRANKGIKVLLRLLQPRMVTSPAAFDCLRALKCQVLLGLARDESIAHILTKLQVGKKLSELIRDFGSQTTGSGQNRWQAELVQVTIELIGVVTNSGRASTLVASDATAPTLRRIERPAIAAVTPITYDSRELLLLIHEHLHTSGLAGSAAKLLKEAQLTPVPSLAIPTSGAHQASVQETSSIQIQWPSGRAPRGFLSDMPKISSYEDSSLRCPSAASSMKKKPLVFSALREFSKTQAKLEELPVPSNSKLNTSSRRSAGLGDTAETPLVSAVKSGGDVDDQTRIPIVLPMKRKLNELKETGFASQGKRLNTGEHTLRSPVFPTTNTVHRNDVQLDSNVFCTPSSTLKDHHGRLLTSTLPADADENQYAIAQMDQSSSSHHEFLKDPQPSGSERLTLDSNYESGLN